MFGTGSPAPIGRAQLSVLEAKEEGRRTVHSAPLSRRARSPARCQVPDGPTPGSPVAIAESFTSRPTPAAPAAATRSSSCRVSGPGTPTRKAAVTPDIAPSREPGSR